MSRPINKKKYVRTRKETVVKFVDDNDVTKIEEFDNIKNEKSKNEIKQKSCKEADKCVSVETKRKRKKEKISSGTDSDDDCNSNLNSKEFVVSKPVALFQDGDVPGKAVFGFHTPKRKNAMAEKASESADKVTPNKSILTSSPRTPSSSSKMYNFTPRARKSILLKLNAETPKTSSPKQKKKGGDRNELTDSKKKSKTGSNISPQKVVPKTPYSLRARLKTKIAAKIASEFQDFSDSEDDFVPSDIDDEDDEDDDDNGSSSDSESDDVFKKSKQHSAKVIDKREPLKVLHNVPSHKLKRNDLTYAITADEYFSHNSGKKSKTSNHTLNRLKNPKLAQDQLDKLLHDADHKCSHQSSLEALCKESCLHELFRKWCFYLKEGYSILLYGLGSKRFILNTFHQKFLSSSHVFVINGFFPGLTLKDIIDSLAGELLNIKDIPSQQHEVLELIEEKLSTTRSPQIFIIVHNLDGVMLRSDKAQALLARLASIPKCHLLASIDHINAPLLWDDKKLSEYNFVWEDVTTYNMYAEETSFENSLLVQRSSSLALASLKSVFQSLTKNGKEIFKILLEDCLTNKKNQKYFGIGFSDLYWRCRDNFLVSTDLALRSQLTEFLDHQLVKWRKDSDHLIIPIESSVLEQFQNLLQDSVLM